MVKVMDIVECICCHDMVYKAECGAANTKHRGKRYVCPICQELESYGADNYSAAHEKVGHGYSVKLKLQGAPKSDESFNAMLHHDYDIVATRSKHRDSQAVVYHTPWYQNDKGIKSMLRSFISYNDLENSGYLPTITIRNESLISQFDIVNLQMNDHIFDALRYEMESLETETLQMFGKRYRSENPLFIFNEDGSITLNCCRVTGANQFYWLTRFMREVVHTISANFIKYVGTDKEAHKAGITANKLVSLYYKYVDQRAECHRERNNARAI